MMKKQALLLVGSLKRTNSTSDFLGSYLLNLLDKKGFKTEKIHVSSFFGKEEEKNKFLCAISDSNVMIFSCPLYIDGPPYSVTKAMEIIFEHRKNMHTSKRVNFLVISNGGYPEAHHNETAALIYKNFAMQSNFKWLGSLILGMGATITIVPLRMIILAKIKKSLLLAAEFISKAQPIPEDLANVIARPLVPMPFYSFMARAIARFFALTNRAGTIYTRPYEQFK